VSKFQTRQVFQTIFERIWNTMEWIMLSITKLLALFRNDNFFSKTRCHLYIASCNIWHHNVGHILSDIICRFYLYNFNPDAKYSGFCAVTNSIILLRDLKLIKAVFVKSCFCKLFLNHFPVVPVLSILMNF